MVCHRIFLIHRYIFFFSYAACDHEGEAKALMMQGNCEIRAGKVTDAAESFYKVLLMHIKAKRVEETCEARICLIQAFLK